MDTLETLSEQFFNGAFLDCLRTNNTKWELDYDFCYGKRTAD